MPISFGFERYDEVGCPQYWGANPRPYFAAICPYCNMVGTVFQFGRPDLDQEELEHAIQDTRIKMAQQGCQALIHLAEKFERELTSDAEFPITG